MLHVAQVTTGPVVNTGPPVVVASQPAYTTGVPVVVSNQAPVVDNTQVAYIPVPIHGGAAGPPGAPGPPGPSGTDFSHLGHSEPCTATYASTQLEVRLRLTEHGTIAMSACHRCV